jgi:putative cardiolipin synthase
MRGSLLRMSGWGVLAVFLFSSAGCATVGPRPELPPSQAVDGKLTALGRAASLARDGFATEQSGFRALPEASTSFNARVALARRAQASIDAQYYLIGNDEIGRLFLRELRDAALRGVRVRLLVDDLYNAGKDPLLEGLAAYPNVQVRLFNPLAVRSDSFNWRVAASLWEFERIDHRMHNKLFVADNAFAVSGGRNMADEYFEQSAEADFVDVDLLSAGPIVQSMSESFDSYWNSERAYPVASVLHTARPDVARAKFDQLVAEAGPGLDERALDVLDRAPVGRELDGQRLRLIPAEARLMVDDPMKAASSSKSPSRTTVSEQTVALMGAAQKNVRIVSPYFIPGERAMDLLEKSRGRNVSGNVTVVTNSLGSTDEPLVYAEYAKYRLRMLRAGVRIFEVGARPDNALAPDASHVGTREGAITRLHAKVATIDEHLVYVGSMNFDGRSAHRNTEIGLLIDSPALAQSLSAISRRSLLQVAYQLRLSADGSKILWVHQNADGREVVTDVEPQSDLWTRLKFALLLPWVDQDEL